MQDVERNGCFADDAEGYYADQLTQEQRLLAVYQLLHDELSQIIEEPTSSDKLKAAIGDYKYQYLVELLTTAAEVG
jgi:hypothetical protein